MNTTRLEYQSLKLCVVAGLTLVFGWCSLSAQDDSAAAAAARALAVGATNTGATNAGATNTAAKAVSPEERRMQEILKLQFDRRPVAVLKALASRAEVRAGTNDVLRYQNDVVAGEWQAVGAFLGKLPTNHVAQVYRHLLTELQKAPRPQSSPDEPPVRPTGRPAESGLLPDDILALAEAKPGDLEEEHIDLLGKLLTKALAGGAFIEPLMARLEAGTPRFGGKEAGKRAAAVTLLLAANRLVEAGKFLPPLDPAMKDADAKALDMHARYLTALGTQEKKPDALRQAWDVTQSLLSTTNSALREQALQRSLVLMPALSRELGTNWLRDSFRSKPAQGMALMAAIGALVGPASRDVAARQRALELQRRMVDELFNVAGGSVTSWEPALNMLALGWLEEADLSRLRYFKPRQYSPYGYSPYFYGQDFEMDEFGNMMQRGQNPNVSQPVPIEQLLPTAPGAAWLAVLDRSLVPRVRTMMAELHLKIEEDMAALPFIEALAPGYPQTAQRLAHDVLRTWTRSRNPMPGVQNPRYGPIFYGPGSPYGMNPNAIPLTRAKQVRNLQELGELLARLRKLPMPALDEKVVVAAFASSHSPAEVFRMEDVEKVFGAFDGMKVETLAEILQTMRARLAGQWRAPALQQQAKTKRSDKEIEAEVRRGYAVVNGLLTRALARLPDDWRLNAALGAVQFDAAEYDYGKGADLAVYTQQRDRAFRAFQKAAGLYAAAVEKLEEKDWTPQVFQQWFNATLGASDLAYLTRQTAPQTNHLDQVRLALGSLPAHTQEKHLTAFGKSLSDSATSLKPELKPRYLRSGLRVIAQHESAAEARKLIGYYDDLLNEILLDVRVDGDAVVGHQRPFGLFVHLRHSAALSRESGGFTKYLQNQQGNQYYFNPYGQQPVNYRDDFEKRIRETLTKGFEVVSVTFHDDKVQPRGVDKPGWRETPLAYVLLKAKDAAVDRVPPLAMDLDFYDTKGQVVLPVESQVVLIDARPEAPPERPVSNIEVTQILDERDLKKGKMTLEIKATAKGLVPDLKSLFDAEFAGFKVDKTADNGLAVTKMDAEGDRVLPVCERVWLLNLSVTESDRAPDAFRFPKSKAPDLAVTYKRYADADLAEVKAELALAGVPLKPRSIWKVVVAACLAAVALLVILIRLARRAPVAAVQVAVYAMPAQLTPFTVLNLLRRMSADEKLPLPQDRRQELVNTIGELEKQFFDRNGHETPPDLREVAQHWLALAPRQH